MHAGRGFFANAPDTRGDPLPEAGVISKHAAQPVHEHDFFCTCVVRCCRNGASKLVLEALVDQHRGVATVVEDQVRALSVGPVEELFGCPPVFLERLALPGEHRNTRRSIDSTVGTDCHSGSCVVLGREDVARHPADVSAERGERLDKHCCLDGHVERADDASTSERLLVAVARTK